MGYWRITVAILAVVTLMCGLAGVGRAEIIVTLIEDNVSTPVPLTSTLGNIEEFNGSTTDFDVATMAREIVSPPTAMLRTSFFVENNSSSTKTVTVEVEDTGPGGAGFMTPTAEPLSLLASVSVPALSDDDAVTMQSGLSSPVSDTPSFLTTPELLVQKPGPTAGSNSNFVTPASATYDLFSYLTFTLGPGAVENVSAATAISVPEPSTCASLLALAGVVGLIWVFQRRRAVT
jgi:hypothetical protein